MGRLNHMDGLFTKLSQKDIRSAAFKAIGARSQAAITHLTMSYWEGARANPQVITQRWLADRIHANPKTAGKVIDDLETHWFLELERKGKLTGPLGERGALYRLTWLPTSDGHPPGHDSRRWLPQVKLPSVAKTNASTRRLLPSNAARIGARRGKSGSVEAPTDSAWPAAGKASVPRVFETPTDLAKSRHSDTRNGNPLSACERSARPSFLIGHAAGTVAVSIFHPITARQISHMISR